MKRFLTALLAIVLAFTAGFSFLQLPARAEAERPEAPPWEMQEIGSAPETPPAASPAGNDRPAPTPLPPLLPTSAPSAAPTPTAAPSAVPTESPAPSAVPTESPAPSAAPSPAPRTTEPPRESAPPIAIETPAPADTPEPQGRRPGYYVKVNVTANTVTVYTSNDQGVYDQPYRAMVCSTGEATPLSGVYTLGWRLQWQTLFGGVYGQYVTQITGNILFHSVPYTEYGNKASLEYWEFDQLGTACSMGCVRLQVKDAKWVYDNKAAIVSVEFYCDSDPGPLGKPSAPQISGNERCRDWDPTDPDPDNPWLGGDEPEPTPMPEPITTPSPEPTPEPELETISDAPPSAEPPAPQPSDDGGDEEIIIFG